MKALLFWIPAFAGMTIYFISCASFNDAMTPSVTVKKDSFDGSTIISQLPVSAASSLSEGWHLLGFEWNSKTPKVIYLNAGWKGIKNVNEVAFNADSILIDDIRAVSTLTSFDDNNSIRRFIISWSNFLKLAKAKDVKMKVSGIDEYSVSSFGNVNSGAIVNTKFEPFIKKVEEARK